MAPELGVSDRGSGSATPPYSIESLQHDSTGRALRLTVETRAHESSWDGWLAAAGGSVFHSYAWGFQKCHDGRRRPLFFRWFERGASEPCSVALGIQHPAPRSMRGVLGTRLTFDSPPTTLADGPDFAGSVLAWCGRSRSIVEVTLGSRDARAPWSGSPLPQSAEHLEFRMTPRGEDEALKGMRKGTRSSIKRALNAGVEARVASAPEEFASFARLYRSTLARLERTKGIAHQSLDADRFARSLAILAERGRGRLYAASLGGELLAGCYFGLFEDSAYYLYNASGRKGLQVGATPLLLLEAERELGRAGVRRLNLGSVPAGASNPGSKDHGLYQFKLGIGAEPVVCAGGRVATRPRRAEIVGLAAGLKARYDGLLRRRAGAGIDVDWPAI